MFGECQQCKNRRKMTRHHIKPRCRGGGNEASNIMLVCRPCHDILDAALNLKPESRSRDYSACASCGDVSARLKYGICAPCRMSPDERTARKARSSWLKSEIAGRGIECGPDSIAERISGENLAGLFVRDSLGRDGGGAD